MQPQAFYDLAERLFNNEKNPGGFRSAISRAYYGAFHQRRRGTRRASGPAPRRGNMMVGSTCGPTCWLRSIRRCRAAAPAERAPALRGLLCQLPGPTRGPNL
jgi:hypothetical protein